MDDFYLQLLKLDPISPLMVRYLNFLEKIEFKPKVIYDIGTYNGNWYDFAKEIFPDARVIGFEANSNLTFYENVFKEMYYECLSNEDFKEVKFYHLPELKKIASYYKPEYAQDEMYSDMTTRTLSSFVEEKGLPEPDLVHINTCGSEMDIIKGGEELIKKAKYLIVNLQNNETFKQAPMADVVGPYIKSLGFEVKDILDCNGTPMIDYVFENNNL